MWSSCRFVLALLVGVTAAEAKPSRVVSLNLCADQFVVALADRARIAALSPLAADPSLSAAAEAARGLPRARPVLEEILPLRPDLAIAGAWGGARVAAVLEARGVRVLRLGLAANFDDILAQARSVAEALDEVARGEALVAAMEARLAALSRPQRNARALVWEARGFTAGEATLADWVLRAAGWRNAAKFADYGTVPLERILASPPDLLIVLAAATSPSLSEALLDHPALRGLPRLALPAAWLACGGPETLRAVEVLTAK
ncbi:MAG: ABC transporter substrate-binding protein [Elioraea sp.]|nr:ABC transporter substrate-binding protein [Elioraea sp.]